MKTQRRIIHIDEEKCDGCGLCIPSCAEGAIRIVNGKAHLIAEKYCDGLGACLGDCPRNAISIIEREAEEFDHAAVEQHMKSQKPNPMPVETTMACGCPSQRIQSFTTTDPCRTANEPVSHTETPSTLSHWPVQIRLVPPQAPFLKNADLLVAADCTPVAYPRFHNDFLKQKVVLIGCPKFDDIHAYTEKFAQIFHENTIKSITVVVMEVPCCQGLPVMISTALTMADKTIPLDVVVISTRGEILSLHHPPS
jgi:Pyruvate/2-oxoacid:ferredoxin oxidoreductase delta subunit